MKGCREQRDLMPSSALLAVGSNGTEKAVKRRYRMVLKASIDQRLCLAFLTKKAKTR